MEERLIGSNIFCDILWLPTGKTLGNRAWFTSCGLSWGVQKVFQARLIRHAVDDGFLSKGCCFDNEAQGDIEKHIFFRTILECEENECLPLQGSGSTPSL